MVLMFSATKIINFVILIAFDAVNKNAALL